jgi:hypothetical protein
LSNSGTGSGSGGPSSSQKKSRRDDSNEKNPGYLPRAYTAFVRPVAMRYYAHRDMDMLERSILDNGLDGYVALCKELCNEFMNACDTSERGYCASVERGAGSGERGAGSEDFESGEQEVLSDFLKY